MKKFQSALLALMVVFGAACSYVSTAPTEFACAYGDGPFDSKEQLEISPIRPSSGRTNVGWLNKKVVLRADVRNYIIDRDPGSGDVPDVDFISSPAEDGVELEYELSVRFRINYDKGCDLYDEHGQRFNIDTAQGWNDFLAQNLRPVIDNRLKRQSQRYGWEDVWRNSEIDVTDDDGKTSKVATWEVIQDDLGQALVDEVNRSLGDNYLCGVTWTSGSTACPPFEVLIKSVVPEREDLTNRYADIQAEEAETEKQAAQKARELAAVDLDKSTRLAQADADLEVASKAEEAAKVQARASVAECVELTRLGVDCVMHEAVKSGSIEFWVVGEDVATPLVSP